MSERRSGNPAADGGGRQISGALALGAALYQCRLERDLSLRRLAQRLGFSSHSGLLDYERGRRIPPENLVAAYEREFGITTGYLRALRERALRERAEEMVGTLIDRYGPADSGQAASARTAGRPPPAGFVPRLAHTVLALPGCMAAAVRAAWHVSGEPDRP